MLLRSEDMGRDRRRASASIAYLLSQALTGNALNKQREVQENNRQEAWRVLYKSANQSTGKKWSTAISEILAPGFFEDHSEFLEEFTT